MARWAWLTLLLYATALTVLSAPLLLWAFPADVKPGELAKDVVDGRTWGWWLWIGVLTVLEGLVLLVPVRIAQERPVRRGPWITLAVVSALLLGLLLFTGILAVAEALWKDQVREGTFWTGLAAGGAGWVFWTFLLLRLRRGRDDRRALRGATRTLLAGSLAELLVAVPCHVYIRKKEYCCAGFLTFSGLATGFAVLLFAFGPAVYFLFVDRLRRLRPPGP